MTTKSLRTLVLAGAAALVLMTGLTALAAGDGHGSLADHFAAHFSGHAGGHAGGHAAAPGCEHSPMGGAGPFAMHFQMMKLVDDLDLTAEQKTHLEAVHQILAGQWEARGEHHSEMAQTLASRLDQGPLTPEEVRPMIDEHLEQFRGAAYAISDEVIALVNSLDEPQRATLRAHLQAMHGDGAAAEEN